MKKVKVSIITICFNAFNDIENTILSVINQNYDNKEYIIIDGYSTDGTKDIIKKYNSHITYWKSEPDRGIFDAMNKGLNVATGSWVIFMNAGDTFYNSTVIDDIFGKNEFTYKHIIYGDTLYLRKESTDIEIAKEPSYIAKNMPTAHQSFFVNLNDAKHIKFDLKYKYAADYNMIYKLYKEFGERGIVHINKPVSKYEACLGLTMQRPNDVFHETLKIRSWSLSKFCGYLRYYIKRFILRKP